MTAMPEKLETARKEFIKNCGLTIGTPTANIMEQSWDACWDHLEPVIREMREALEFYGEPSVWGIAFPGECTSIESIDEWEFKQPNGEPSKRGGKRARQAIAKAREVLG